MSFDYFYGPDDAEQYSFYRIPKRLITGDEFQETNTEAKLLYGLMLDRLQLSIRNQWLDSLNRVYIIYTVETSWPICIAVTRRHASCFRNWKTKPA